jgi:hypothetical protein
MVRLWSGMRICKCMYAHRERETEDCGWGELWKRLSFATVLSGHRGIFGEGVEALRHRWREVHTYGTSGPVRRVVSVLLDRFRLPPTLIKFRINLISREYCILHSFLERYWSIRR